MKSRGFTLIELLVALVVLALMAPLLASGLRLGLRAWDDVEARTRQRQDLHLAGLFLARALEQARPGAFAGNAHAMEFVAPAPAPMGRGLQAYSVVFAAPGRLELKFGTGAVSATIPDARLADEAGGDYAAILAEGIAEARFDYLRPGKEGTPGAWVSTWEPGDPPRLVRLRLRLLDGGARVFEVLAAPRVSAPQLEGG